MNKVFQEEQNVMAISETVRNLDFNLKDLCLNESEGNMYGDFRRFARELTIYLSKRTVYRRYFSCYSNKIL
jgi:hypothetical protein